MAKGRRRIIAAVAAVAAGAAVIGWAGHAIWASSWPAPGQATVADARACRLAGGTNVPFDEVMRHFGLGLPPHAGPVVFTADVNPLFGTYDLELRFTTTTAGLRSFLARAGLPPLSPDSKITIDGFGSARCGLAPPANRHMTYSQDSPDGPMAKSPRAMAADFTNPARPVVWITAFDL